MRIVDPVVVGTIENASNKHFYCNTRLMCMSKVQPNFLIVYEVTSKEKEGCEVCQY